MTFTDLSRALRPALLMSVVLTVPACKKEETAEAVPEEVSAVKAGDMPVLDLLPGHRWVYRVTVTNPHDSRSGKAAVGSFERVRRYLGKIDPGNGKEAAHCFEVSAEGSKVTREFVSITPEAISILGQATVGADGKPAGMMWLSDPIPFFQAGVMAGDSMPVTMLNKDKNLWRVTRVIGREKISVPAGEFQAVRLQTFGSDEKISLRKTYWFCPGKGLIKEEAVREVDGKPVMIETEELTSWDVGKR